MTNSAPLVYTPGRSARDVIEAHGLAEAVKLSSNELPFAPLPAVAELIATLAGSPEGLNRYPDFAASDLRRAIADRHAVTPEQVAVGGGSSNLVMQLAAAYVRTGDRVLAADPSFDLYRIAAALNGGAGELVSVCDHTVDVGGLVDRLGADIRLAFVANPNNPTSTAVPLTEIRGFAEQMPIDSLLVVDEAYIDFAGQGIESALALLETHSNVVVLRTFSKAHGLAGLRVGYLVAAPEVVATVNRYSPPFQVSSLGQAAATVSIREVADLERRVAEIVAERRRVSAGIAELGWAHPASETNFVWLPVGGGAPALAAALECSGVITRAITGHGVRITIGTPAQNDLLLRAMRSIEGHR